MAQALRTIPGPSMEDLVKEVEEQLEESRRLSHDPRRLFSRAAQGKRDSKRDSKSEEKRRQKMKLNNSSLPALAHCSKRPS